MANCMHRERTDLDYERVFVVIDKMCGLIFFNLNFNREQDIDEEQGRNRKRET